MLVRIMYEDVTEMDKVKTWEIPHKMPKILEIYGHLYTDGSDGYVRIAFEKDLDKNDDETEHGIIIIPEACVKQIHILKVGERFDKDIA